MKKQTPSILICCMPSDLSGVPAYVKQITALHMDFRIIILTKERGTAFSNLTNSPNIELISDPELENLMTLGSLIKCRSILRHHIANLKPDLVHLNGTMFAVAARTIHFDANTKILITHHGLPYSKGATIHRRIVFFIIELILTNISRAANIYITKKQYQTACSYQIDNRNNYLVSNTTNLANNYNVPSAKKYGEMTRIISVAVYRKQKNHTLLLKSFAELDTSFYLDLVGRGTDSAEMYHTAKKHLSNSALDRISFFGERSDISTLLLNADIFLLTSDYEGMPIAALEAQSLGLPIVITNVGGAEEIVGDKLGKIVDNASPQAIAEAIKTLQQSINSGEWNPNDAICHFNQNFSPLSFQTRMKDLYIALLRQV